MLRNPERTRALDHAAPLHPLAARAASGPGRPPHVGGRPARAGWNGGTTPGEDAAGRIGGGPHPIPVRVLSLVLAGSLWACAEAPRDEPAEARVEAPLTSAEAAAEPDPKPDAPAASPPAASPTAPPSPAPAPPPGRDRWAGRYAFEEGALNYSYLHRLELVPGGGGWVGTLWVGGTQVQTRYRVRGEERGDALRVVLAGYDEDDLSTLIPVGAPLFDLFESDGTLRTRWLEHDPVTGREADVQVGFRRAMGD